MDFLMPDTLFLAAVAFFSYAAQSISGFGSTVVAVTLGAHFFPLPVLIPSLVFLDMLLNGYLTYRYAGHIQHRLLWTRIIPFMAAGVAAGLVLFDLLAGNLLKQVLGFFKCSHDRLFHSERSVDPGDRNTDPDSSPKCRSRPGSW
jgi:uncharacterized protein